MASEQPPSRREGLLVALLGAISDAPVCVLDRDLRMVEYFWGREEPSYGYSLSEILGKRFSELVSAEDAAPVEQAVREVFATGEPRRLTRDFGLPVGRTAFDVRLDPIRGPTGEVENVLSTSYDVTERQRAQEALRESERLFASLAEAAPVGIVRIDSRGDLVYANRVTQEIVGLPFERMKGTGWMDAVVPDDREKVAALRREDLAATGGRDVEVSFLHPDGSIVCALTRSIRAPAAGGAEPGFLATLLDITERKRFEEALRESEHRFHSLAEAMPIGVWRTDCEPKIVYANRRNWEILDVDPDEGGQRDLHALLAGMAASSHLDSEESARLWDESKHAVRDPMHTLSRIRLQLADGKVRDLQTLAIPEFDSAGHFVGHVGVTMDVTDLTRAQEELARHRDKLGELVAERTLELERSYEALRRSERLAAVGTFAAGIAHQINNPVGAMLLAAQFALEDPGNRERVGTALRDIVTDARHCGRIVRGVLELAQGPGGAPRPCDLNQIVRAGVRKLTVDCAERGAALRLELDAGLPPAAGSETALEQVLVNLVYNSLEAAAHEIAIATRRADAGIELVVRDDGCGIAEENLDRIFDPFFTTRSSLGGTGLGLALARGVVEAHGGSIEVSSREAEGTRIIVRLKRAAPAASARRSAS